MARNNPNSVAMNTPPRKGIVCAVNRSFVE